MFKLLKNDQAVSPVVATLVLIVVAIIGAAAVGLLMGSFSSNVSEEMNTGDTADASSAELLIAGSTTVFPVSEELAKAYMAKHSGVKVTVQAGGSGAGILAASKDACDIGSSSAALTETQKTAFPTLQQTEIGASAVVVILKQAAGSPIATVTAVDTAALNAMYDADTDKDGIITVTNTVVPTSLLGADDTFVDDGAAAFDAATMITLYQRAEESGTEETFAQYTQGSSTKSLSTGAGVTGNSGMVAAITGSTAGALGFADWGYVSGLTTLTRCNLDGEVADSDNIKTTLKGQTGGYPAGMTRPLIYLTNGNPSTLEQSFIDFALSTEAKTVISKAGVFSTYDYQTVA